MQRVHNQAVHHPDRAVDRIVHIPKPRQNLARLPVVKKAEVQRLHMKIEARFEIQPHVDADVTRKIRAQQSRKSQISFCCLIRAMSIYLAVG